VIVENDWFEQDKSTYDRKMKEIQATILNESAPKHHKSLWVINQVCKKYTGEGVDVSYSENVSGSVKFIARLPILRA
jgi:hypothetical protein